MVGRTQMRKRIEYWKPFSVAGLSVVSALFGAGCTSTTSTILQRLDGDELVGSSNGHNTLLHANKPFKGIPITVSVPTHVDIRIDETLYFKKESMEPIALSSRHLTAHPTIVTSDKLISVDPKRPAAGTLDYNLTFPTPTDDYRRDQHFNKITYNVDDQTIKTITSILKDVVPTLGIGAKKTKGFESDSPDGSGSSDSLQIIVRTVAWKRFDLSAPDLEPCIAEFVATHLNNCHSCNENLCVHQEDAPATQQQPAVLKALPQQNLVPSNRLSQGGN